MIVAMSVMVALVTDVHMVVHFATGLIYHDIVVAPGLFVPGMVLAMIWDVYRLILILMAMRKTALLKFEIAIAGRPIIVPGGLQVEVLGLVSRFAMVTFQLVEVVIIQLIAAATFQLDELGTIQLIAVMETGKLLDWHTVHLIVVDSSDN